MSDLQILFPQPVTVRVGVKKVRITPVQFPRFEEFGKAAGALIEVLASDDPYRIYGYAKSSGALTTILGACTSLWGWQIRRLPAPVAVELMVHVIRVNSSFFDQALVSASAAMAGAERSRS